MVQYTLAYSYLLVRIVNFRSTCTSGDPLPFDVFRSSRV